MHPAELVRLVGELRLFGSDTQRVEVKSNVGRSVLETLSAFSNADGGVLLVGLTEQNGFTPVPGFDPKKATDALVSRCAQLTPPVHPAIEMLEFEGNIVVVATVDELLPRDKPCYVTERGRYHGAYLRTGDGDVRLRPYEVDRLLEEHTQPRWDEEPIADAHEDDLSNETLTPFLERQRSSRPKTFADGDPVALQRLRVMRGEHPTLAALLAMGRYPQQFFPRLTVTFAVFPGISKGDIGAGIRLLDKATLSGPIPELVEDTLAHVSRNMRVGALIQEAFRHDLPDYPLVAVREAIVNALMHRDYSPHSLGTQVQVNLYADRLEIVSPGGLYGTVTLRTLGQAGLSSTRNQRLATMLEDVALPSGGPVAENRGTGFAVIQTELAKAMMPPAEVRDDLASFTIVFRRRLVEAAGRPQTTLEQVATLLKQRASASTTELVAASGLSRTAVQKAINDLIATGRAQAMAPPRSPRQRYRAL